MAQLAEYNETGQEGPRKHSSLLTGMQMGHAFITADGACFETQILET